MRKRKTYFIFVLILLPILTIAQNKNSSDYEIINLIEGIDSESVSISFQNTFEVNNNGGHLQGIQYYRYNQNDYYFLSGSSDSSSYYSVVKMGKVNSVISINRILDKPFKHAGGFQIYQNLMAIGIEDNSERDRSKVFVYRLDDPENLPREPIETIERVGTPKRATSGCVSIIEIDDHLLVAVGDWDTEHLDFYSIEKKNLGKNSKAFKLVYIINTENLDKSEWINDSWLPYQNINFIKDSSDNIYLACMATNENEENIMDLFIIETKDLSTFKLKKIHTKRFAKNEDSKFQWGAGVYISDENKLKIFSCGAHIQKESKIFVFE